MFTFYCVVGCCFWCFSCPIWSLFGFLALVFLMVWISTSSMFISISNFIHGCCCRHGFVFLFLLLFIRNADWRQLFWYFLVFVLRVVNWDPRVLCGWFFLFLCSCYWVDRVIEYRLSYCYTFLYLCRIKLFECCIVWGLFLMWFRWC